MSTIAEIDWLPYLRPSIKGRRTSSVSMPDQEPTGLSRLAKDPRLTVPHTQIDRVAGLPKNWDGYGSARPNEHAAERARQLLEDAFHESTATSGWQNPYISASEDGEFVLEWWNGLRKLTIYVGAERSTFLKSWGPHIVNDMEDGELTQTWDRSLWAWLFG